MFDKLCRDTVGLPSGCSPILHQMVWLGMFQGGWNGFAAQRNKLSCRPTLGVNYTQLAPDEKSCGSWRISVTPKASAGCKSTLAFGSSHEARRRRMAVFFIQLTRKPHRTSEPRGPSPSGGISQSIHMSPYAPAHPRRSPGVKGYYPLREACRRATVSSQPTHTSPYAPARRRRAVRGQWVLPLARAARPVAERRYFAALPMPLRAVGAQSERGTQSPILPRTMKRAPSKV